MLYWNGHKDTKAVQDTVKPGQNQMLDLAAPETIFRFSFIG